MSVGVQVTEPTGTETLNSRAAIKLDNEVLLESYFHIIEEKMLDW
jgi:hypothetical protein